MAPIQYAHHASPALVRVLFCVIHSRIQKLLGRGADPIEPGGSRGRVAALVLLLVALVVQVLLLVLISQLIDACLAIFELYVSLAETHLALTA